jgi:hypothetical protein
MPPKQKYRWPYVKPPPLNPNPSVGPPSSPEPDSRRRKRRKRPESSSELDEFPKVQEKVVAASDSLADDKLSDRKKKNENQSPNEQARVPAQKYKKVVRQINPNARAITKEPFVPQT